MAANNPQVLNITLAEESKLMNEVVIVGYGTQRRRESVGSITKVDSKELKEVIGASFQTQLQGKAPEILSKIAVQPVPCISAHQREQFNKCGWRPLVCC